MTRRLALCAALLLGGCIPHGERPPALPLRRAAPPPAFQLPAASTRQCIADLGRRGVGFTPLPDQVFGGGCSAVGAVQLSTIAPGVVISNTKALRCATALPLATWFEGPVQAAAQRWFGARVVRLESMGTYACRAVIGNAAVAGRLSEHARANAVDIGAVVLEGGRRSTVLGGWRGALDEQGFWHEVHDAACQQFITVLSPDYL